jgi:hypothetical protein
MKAAFLLLGLLIAQTPGANSTGTTTATATKWVKAPNTKELLARAQQCRDEASRLAHALVRAQINHADRHMIFALSDRRRGLLETAQSLESEAAKKRKHHSTVGSAAR